MSSSEERGVGAGASPSVRVDRWLCAARIFKTRSLAQAACEGGHVEVNGRSAKPSQGITVGDRVEALAPRGKVIVTVAVLEIRRQSPARARALYDDHSPPPPPRAPRFAVREPGSARPTKKDRRALQRLRDR